MFHTLCGAWSAPVDIRTVRRAIRLTICRPICHTARRTFPCRTLLFCRILLRCRTVRVNVCRVDVSANVNLFVEDALFRITEFLGHFPVIVSSQRRKMERYVSEVDGLGFEVKENSVGNNSPFPEGIVNVTKLVVLHGQRTRVGGEIDILCITQFLHVIDQQKNQVHLCGGLFLGSLKPNLENDFNIAMGKDHCSALQAAYSNRPSPMASRRQQSPNRRKIRGPARYP